MSTSPTARTLQECKKRGITAQVVERFNTYTKRRIDLFGVIDIVAITPEGILGIQATGGAGGNHASRRHKIHDEPRAAQWIAAGAKLEIWSWAKQGAAGKRKLWTLRVERVQLADFPVAEGWETRAVVPSQQAAVTEATAPAKVRKRAATVKVATHGPDGWPL